MRTQIARHGIVLEVETGYMDGSYSQDTEEMVDHWNEVRPEYTHVAVYTNNFFPIPDDRFLANIFYKVTS